MPTVPDTVLDAGRRVMGIAQSLPYSGGYSEVEETITSRKQVITTCKVLQRKQIRSERE